MNVAYNADCLPAMREMPDNAFDLAVVDPPYGDGSQVVQVERERERTTQNVEQVRSAIRPLQVDHLHSSRRRAERERRRDPDGRDLGGEVRKKIIAWDTAPEREYFDQLFRVSREQIIWGGNYFDLPPTRCFLVWRKITISESFTMAMAEYAWTSFNSNAKVFEFPPQGKPGDRFHPTQKPIELYAWIYRLYAKPGMKILDTHLGSGSSRIAAYDAGLDFTGYEIDKQYFDLQEERFAKHTSQRNLFLMAEEEQTQLTIQNEGMMQ